MLVAPEPIRNQLKEVVKRMLEEGFPELFPGFKEAVHAVRATLPPPLRTTTHNHAQPLQGAALLLCSTSSLFPRNVALTSVLSATLYCGLFGLTQQGLGALDNERMMSATLLILHQLAKRYQFEKLDDRVAYVIIRHSPLIVCVRVFVGGWVGIFFLALVLRLHTHAAQSNEQTIVSTP
jgi:hypothetical protein